MMHISSIERESFCTVVFLRRLKLGVGDDQEEGAFVIQANKADCGLASRAITSNGTFP